MGKPNGFEAQLQMRRCEWQKAEGVRRASWQGEGSTAFNQCSAAEGLLLSEIVQAHWLNALPAATF